MAELAVPGSHATDFLDALLGLFSGKADALCHTAGQAVGTGEVGDVVRGHRREFAAIGELMDELDALLVGEAGPFVLHGERWVLEGAVRSVLRSVAEDLDQACVRFPDESDSTELARHLAKVGVAVEMLADLERRKPLEQRPGSEG